MQAAVTSQPSSYLQTRTVPQKGQQSRTKHIPTNISLIRAPMALCEIYALRCKNADETPGFSLAAWMLKEY
jgi:hypothetical protein